MSDRSQLESRRSRGARHGPARWSRAALLVGLLVAALPSAASNTNPALRGGPRHPMPVRPPGAPTAAAPVGAHLTYFGGPVVSHVAVVQVLWGAGTYQPFVTQAAAPSMASFYAGVTDSPYLDWLAEYATTQPAAGGGAGTGQAIGRGTFVGRVVLTPSPAAAGATIDDVAIEAELVAQLAAGTLPAPATSPAGFVETVYMVHFPAGVTITEGGTTACAAGGFCGYHGTVLAGATPVAYAVLPDMSAGSGCDLGCGPGVPFADQTTVASHELVEAITDPQVGLAPRIAAPLAWYDTTNGEIGDICGGLVGTVVGGDGRSYTVQREWSNAANACVTTNPLQPPPPDFALSITPAARPVAQGTSATLSVAAALRAGTVGPVALSLSPLPAGLSGVLQPASVSPGGSALLTVTASSAARPGRAPFTVTGTSAGLARSAAAELTVLPAVAISPASPQVAPRQPLQLTATGGSATGFAWSLSSAPSGATLDAASGRYRAGTRGGTTDVVQVTDSLGDLAVAAVAVGPGLSISPGVAALTSGETQAFHASGGSGEGLAWALVAAPSGGAIDAASGLYRSGPVGGAVDVVAVTDSLGNAASAQVTVAPRPAAPRGGCQGGPGGSASLLGGLLALGARRRRGLGRGPPSTPG